MILWTEPLLWGASISEEILITTESRRPTSKERVGTFGPCMSADFAQGFSTIKATIA